MTLSPLARWAGTVTVVAATAGFGLASTSAAAADAVLPLTGLVVLGDSLSDNGNLFAMTGSTFPLAPYFNGRFSNGPVAVEYLASGLGFTAPGQFVNLAVAGALTSTAGEIAGTGMLSQLASYLPGMGGGNPLFFVWGGANDLRAAGGAAVAPAITNLTTIVGTLYGLGARNFFLPNMPDLGLTPEARETNLVSPGFAAGATMLAEGFNAALAGAYGTLFAGLPGAQMISFNAMAAQRAITNGSPGNGFTNVSDRCFYVSVPSLCGNPGDFLYFDNIHPTAAAHLALGNQMLAAVPEPETMLMMAIGIVGVLGAARRRQRREAVAA